MNLYFAGKLIQQKMTDLAKALRETAVVLDRLGGVRVRSNYQAGERNRISPGTFTF